jgi:pilus assembly protein FimV
MVPQWQEALAIGRELLPDHPLFAEAGFLDSPATAREAEPGDRAEEWEALEEPVQPAATDWSADRGLRFDVPAPSRPEPVPEPTLEIEPPSSPWEGAREIELPAGDLQPFEPARTDEVTLDVDFDLEPPRSGDPGRGVAPFGEDPVGTKLDLARAYVDMGDIEGARAMLQEVIAEGAEVQRQEARRLLDSLG